MRIFETALQTFWNFKSKENERERTEEKENWREQHLEKSGSKTGGRKGSGASKQNSGHEVILIFNIMNLKWSI